MLVHVVLIPILPVPSNSLTIARDRYDERSTPVGATPVRGEISPRAAVLNYVAFWRSLGDTARVT